MTEQTKFCHQCGWQVRATAQFCPNCGAAQQPAAPSVPSTLWDGFEGEDIPQPARRGRLLVAAAGVLFFLIAVGGVAGWFLWDREAPAATPTAAESVFPGSLLNLNDEDSGEVAAADGSDNARRTAEAAPANGADGCADLRRDHDVHVTCGADVNPLCDGHGHGHGDTDGDRADTVGYSVTVADTVPLADAFQHADAGGNSLYNRRLLRFYDGLPGQRDYTWLPGTEWPGEYLHGHREFSEWAHDLAQRYPTYSGRLQQRDLGLLRRHVAGR